MAYDHLPAFEGYKADEFHIGGDPNTVKNVAKQWFNFGKKCTVAGVEMYNLDTSSFIGSEGDQFSALLHDEVPLQVYSTGHAHHGVERAITSYHEALDIAVREMDGLGTKAQGDHGAVNAAVDRYNAAEAALDAARASAALGVGLTASIYAAMEMEKKEADLHYHAMKRLWDEDLVNADKIKEALGEAVDKSVAEIEAQERLVFASNSTGVQGAQVDGDFLRNSVELLQFAGEMLTLAPQPKVYAAGVILSSAGVAIALVGAVSGQLSWAEVGQSAGNTLAAVNPNRMLKALRGASHVIDKAGNIDRDVDLGEHINEFPDPYGQYPGTVSRGARAVEIAEPVDAASGGLVESVLGIFVSGTLPLVVSRRYESSFGLSGAGGVFGLGWVSSLDCYLEVFDDRVVMLAPDGAVVRFDAPSVNGCEVRGQGREWLLSFVDGAYRVRDVASGIVYIFATKGVVDSYKPSSPVVDDSFGVVTSDGEELQRNWINNGIRPAGFGRGSSTVAAVLGQGVEVDLSLMVHRSGMWIEYVRDQLTGCLARLVRSDGTEVEVSWDHWLHRITKLTVIGNGQYEEEYVGVGKENPISEQDSYDNDHVLGHEHSGLQVGFEYDQIGLLRKVFNPSLSKTQLAYEYDERSLLCGWVDSNGVGYWHVYDEAGRIVAQVGSGGVYANAFVWLSDTASDAPMGGRVCVMIETATIVDGDMLSVGREVVAERLERLQELPLVQALRAGGLQEAGLIGCGRDGARDQTDVNLSTDANIPAEWLFDEVLGDIRASVWRSTAAGDVWRVVSALGVATDYIYNDCHQVIAIVGGDNGVVEFVRDENGQVVETLYPDGTGVRVETGAWDKPIKITNTAGLSVHYELDTIGNITSITDVVGRTTKMEYEWFVSGAVPKKVISPEGQVTTFEYDAAGRVLAAENEQGMRWSVTRDVAGRVTAAMNPLGEVTHVQYSSQGRPTKVVLPDGSSQVVEYDGEGNQVRFVNETGAVTETKYTVFDKPLEITDAAGGVTRIVYNTQLEVVGVINADGHRWDHQYDLDGRLIMESDYNGLITKYEHDQVRNITKIIDPAGGVNTVYSDKAGRTTLMVDSMGREITYSYAKQGWLDSISSSEATISYLRDEFGRLESEHTELATGETITASTERDLTGRMTAMVMDVAGHVTHQQYNYHDVTRELTGINIFHNTPGSMSSAVTSSSASYATMPSVASGLGFVGGVDLGVDELGRRNRFGIGVVDRMLEFDIRGRITADITAAIDPKQAEGFTVVAGRQFSWRADDALIGINDALAGSSVFDVDMLGRVRSIQHDRTTAIQANPRSNGLSTARVRPVSSLLKDNTSGGVGRDVFATEQYLYSAAGQLQHGVSPDYIQHDEIVPRSRAEIESGYEAVSNYDRVTKNTLVTQVGKTSYVYDDLGRVIRSVTKRLSRKPLVKHYQYDASTGQIKKFSSSDHPHRVWEYTYDGVGRRVAKTCMDTRSNTLVVKVVFGYYGDRMVTEHYLYGNDEAGMIARAWITDPKTGSTIAQLSTSLSASDKNRGDGNSVGGRQAEKPHWAQQSITTELHALVTDLAGAPKEIINTTTGNVIGRSVQTLYGQRNWKGNATCPLLFTGQYHDNETNLVYNRYRYYDPVAGVYTSQDPLGQTPDLASPQNYAKNPTTWIDPLGLKTCQVGSQEARLAMQADLRKIADSNPKQFARYGHNRNGQNVNLATMIDSNGNKYYASGASQVLEALPEGVEGTIITAKDAPYVGPGAPEGGLTQPPQGDKFGRIPFHAERILERHAEQNGIEIVEIYSELPYCTPDPQSAAPNVGCRDYFGGDGYNLVGDSRIYTKLDH